MSLGEFVAVLRQADSEGVNLDQYRGRPLRLRDGPTRQAISAVADEYDSLALLRAWEAALQVPEWNGESRFFHGDLHSGNLIAAGRKLVAVIDFGALGTGDPAVDGIAGWWLFDEQSRAVFRDAGDFDYLMWRRAKGWALSIALIALPYHRDSNPSFADMARLAIDEVLADPI